jgi:hypothetical protein
VADVAAGEATALQASSAAMSEPGSVSRIIVYLRTIVLAMIAPSGSFTLVTVTVSPTFRGGASLIVVLRVMFTVTESYERDA